MLIMACIRKNIHNYSFKSQPLCTEICLELLEHVKIFGVLIPDISHFFYTSKIFGE